MKLTTAAATSRTLVLALAAALALPATFAAGAASAAGASITIDDPGAVTAGDVALKGAISTDAAGLTTSVLYAVDVSGSTNAPAGQDCNGDGTPGEAADNVNGDATTGDILDCEIAAVQSLDAGLATSSGSLLTGLQAWSGSAALAQMSPTESVSFVPPGTTGGEAETRMHFVSRYLVRNTIRKYNFVALDPAATDFDEAVRVGVAALKAGPAGPKWMLLMSDVVKEGTTPGSMADPISQTVLDELSVSGVKVRTFGLGGDASCAAGSSLARIAAATGESCIPVTNPGALAANLTGSQPEAVRDVTVSAGGVSVAADINAVGGWSATLRFGPGSYTVTATARMTSGAVVSTSRLITVGAGAGGAGPAPGSVGPGTGSLLATRVGVRQPAPTGYVVPRTVRGRVGLAGRKLGTTAALDGSVVALQGRSARGAPWRGLARGTVNDGRYALSWKGKVKGIRTLRVVLRQQGAFASTTTAVPRPRISACKVRRDDGVRSLICHTTVANGTKARLLDGRVVLDRAKVRKGRVSVATTSVLSGTVLSIDLSAKRHVRLRL